MARLSFNGITKGLTKMVNQLESLVQQNTVEIGEIVTEIGTLEAEKETLEEELVQAVTLAENVRKLLGSN